MFGRTAKQSVQYDMHTHSHLSPESKVPGRLLLRFAKMKNLEGIGICEKDAFPDETLHALAKELQLKLALGIEFSCAEAQIIGYGMHFSKKEKKDWAAYFATIQQAEHAAAAQLTDRFSRWDSTISLEKVALFANKPPCMLFVLQFLVQKSRLFPSLECAWKFLASEYLAAGLPVAELRPPSEVIRQIHSAGGVAIWAHPQMTPKERQQSLLAELLAAGLDAVEAVYPYRENGYIGNASNAVLQARTISLIGKADVLLSGGSDCNYPFSPCNGQRPMLPGEYGITSEEAALFHPIFL